MCSSDLRCLSLKRLGGLWTVLPGGQILALLETSYLTLIYLNTTLNKVKFDFSPDMWGITTLTWQSCDDNDYISDM